MTLQKWILEEGTKGTEEFSIYDPQKENIIGRAVITNLIVAEQGFSPYISLEGSMYNTDYVCNFTRKKIQLVYLSVKDRLIPFYIDKMTICNDYGYRAEYITVDGLVDREPLISDHCKWEIEGHMGGADIEGPRELVELEEIEDRCEILDI